MDKLTELKLKIEEHQARSAFASDFKSFATMILSIVKTAKDNFESISKENQQLINDSLTYLEQEHDKVLQSVENTSQTAKSEATEAITKALEEVKRVAKEVMEMKPKDGERGLDADEEIIVEKVLGKIVLPEYKETVLDGGEQIVDKINALDLSPENQIDASHIKNLPQPKMIGGGSTARNLYQLNDVNISSPTSNQVLKYNSTTNLWENGSGGGSSLTLQTDGVPNTDQTLLNLEAGTNVTLTDNLAGTVTIDVTASNISLETNGIVNNSQSTLNLIAGTNVTLTDDGLGGVTIDASGGGTGTVTSVAATVPTGLTISGSPITAAGTLAIGLDTGYVIPLQTTLDGFVPYTGATANVDLGAHNLTVDTDTFFVDSTNNRVGIGTAVPSQKLHVAGGAKFDLLSDANDFVVSEGATVLFNFNTIDNYVQSISHIPLSNANYSLGTGSYAWSNAYANNLSTGSATNLTISTLTAGYDTIFKNASTELVRFTGTGNVGIGTTSPGAKLDVVGTMLAQHLVEANTAGVASPNIIASTESRKVFTNEGATALNYHTLPTASAGLTFTFYVDDADGIRITANTGDIIQINGVASTTAGYAESTAIGSSLTLTAINATDWVATSSIGSWSLA